MKRSPAPEPRPVLIRPADVPAIYGFTHRQIKRWITEGRIARVKVSGPTGPVHLRTADLDRLIEESTVPAQPRPKPSARRRTSS